MIKYEYVATRVPVIQLIGKRIMLYSGAILFNVREEGFYIHATIKTGTEERDVVFRNHETVYV